MAISPNKAEADKEERKVHARTAAGLVNTWAATL